MWWWRFGPGAGGERVHSDMEWWTRLRVRMAQQSPSKRQVCREEGISWQMLEKVLAHTATAYVVKLQSKKL